VAQSVSLNLPEIDYEMLADEMGKYSFLENLKPVGGV